MIIFPDTNIFLHFEPIENWDWKNEKKNPFEIGICFCIIKEIGEKKYLANNNNIRNRAQNVTKKLTTNPLILNKIHFEIYIPDSLQEILDTKFLNKTDQDDLFIASVLNYKEIHPNKQVQIISNDLEVQLKCEIHNIDYIKPPENYLIKVDDSEAKEIKKLTTEVNRLKNLQPKLKLQFDNDEIYTEFDIQEPLKEYEEEIIRKMELIRKENPLLEPEIEKNFNEISLTDLNFFTGSSLYAKTPERVANYNKAMQEFYVRYEIYLRRTKVHYYKEQLTVILNIQLENEGTTPAENIDLYMHFPDGFTLGEKGDYYADEKEPSPPKLSSFDMAPVELPKISDYLFMPKILDKNLIDFSITKTNSYDVNKHFSIIKHNNHYNIVNPLYVMFDRFEEAKSFEIAYRITAGNTINAEEGKLHVIINKVQ